MPTVTLPPIGVDPVLGSETGNQAFNPILIRISDSIYYLILVSYPNVITSTSLNDGGVGFAVNDTGVINQDGNVSATYIVDSVDGSGTILTYTLTSGGGNYRFDFGVSTATGGGQPGAGTGFLINITGISTDDAILHAYKSTDGGYTWNEQDSANKPDAGAQSGNFYVFHDAANDLIGVLYRTTTPTLKIVTLSTSTDLWGTPGTSFNVATIPGFATLKRYCFYRQSGGTWVVIGGSLSTFPTVKRLYVLTFSSGAWSGPTNITSNNNDGSDVWGGMLGAADVFHFIAEIGPTSGLVAYYQIDASLTLNTKVALPSPPFKFVNGSVPGSGRGSIVLWGADSVAISYATTNGDVRTYIGTPLAAAVFTSYVIYTDVASESTDFSMVMVDKDGALNTFWITTDSVDTPHKLEIDQSVFDGISTWGAPTVFYDEETNPPSTAVVQIMHKLDVIQPAAGGWIATTAMGATGEVHNIQWILLDPAGPPPTQTLELTKIVVGGSAAPEDFTLSAIGGSPEVEIEGQGHVGPEVVSPGVYELSETILSGASWNDATQTWESDDASWNGDYSPGAWDCGGAEMPTPTSVVVPEGGTVACSITNTFVPPTPPPGPGNGEENPVGCFELLRVDVTLMPSRHLPTRGSTR